MATVRFVSRQEWGARDPEHVTTVDKRRRRRFVVHHSTGRNLGDRNPFAWVRAIQRFHMDTRGWSDIGYNELYHYDPEQDLIRVFEGRGHHALGAHVAGHNTESIGGCWLGDYRDGKDSFTAAMWVATRDRQTRAEQRVGRDLVLTGHGDLASTACPGDQILRAIHGDPPGGAPAPPSTADWTEELIMALPTLKTGSRGADVARLQSLLVSAGVRPERSIRRNCTGDGIYGEGTRKAVATYQAAKDVRNSVRSDGTGDGIAGRHTWTALLGQ